MVATGLGLTTPDPKGFYTMEDGVVIPMGVGTKADIPYSSLLYNEYPFSLGCALDLMSFVAICVCAFGCILHPCPCGWFSKFYVYVSCGSFFAHMLISLFVSVSRSHTHTHIYTCTLSCIRLSDTCMHAYNLSLSLSLSVDVYVYINYIHMQSPAVVMLEIVFL